MNRRRLLQQLGAGLTGISLRTSFEWHNDLPIPSGGKSNDEDFWKEFGKSYYKVSPDFINLENGYFGVQPLPVITAYHRHLDTVNMNSSRFMRTSFYQEDFPRILDSVLPFTGVTKEEVLITRNATEALNILIQGYPWEKGDQVILQHHDYQSMIDTYEMMVKRKGIELKYVDIPLINTSPDVITDLYIDAITDRTRCIHLTHLTHLTGQIIPVYEIASEARQRNIDVIVDAAHSFAQVDYSFTDLNCDFIGVNLHKWFGSPLGAGLAYVKKERIGEISPLFGDVDKPADNIAKLGHFGTPALPILLSLTEAAKFNAMVTIPVKEARLRYLQNYWTRQAAGIKGVEITTPVQPDQSCALASFKIEGWEAQDVVNQLDSEFGVFTVIRNLKDQQVVRVTPNLYNTTSDLDRLLEGIDTISKRQP
jgi:selenocysteine lyase/cysteine desulfurase